ncbi:MAG: molybdopterin-dependent oxidoreductase [Ilumatobacteraceae bacterium]
MTHTVNGTCHHDCPDSCGWTVTVDDDQPSPVAVKMRGNPDHPYSYGELCPKVNRYLDRVYSPDRILHPLRRVGPKGSGEFEQISWDDALAEIADRLTTILAESGGDAILPFSDAGNQSLLATQGVSERFFNHIAACRLLRNICGPTVGAGVSMTNGTGLGADALDLEHSNLIILWATNTRLTNRHLWPVIERARERGAELVVIDPIRTITAEVADRFIQPLPGTDIAMMLAMMHVIIRDDLVDREWVDEHTIGFDEIVDSVAETTPAWASAQCGVDAAVIEQLAHDYATVRPAAIRTLIGAEHHENGAMFYRTLACLPALIGSWRERGGGLMRSVGAYQDALVDEAALHRTDLLDGRTPRTFNMSRLGEILLESDDPVRAMIVWNCNPLVIVPNAEYAREGMARDDLFTVVHEQFLTDTAKYADIVLPATTHIESLDVTPAWGHLWMGWNEPAIEPVGEAVSNTECFRRIACAMGLTEPSLFDDDLTILRQSLPTVDLDERPPRRLGTGALRRRRSAVGRRRVPDAVGQGRTGVGASKGWVNRGFRRSSRRPRTAGSECRPVPATTDDPQAPRPVPQLGLLAPAQARSGRGRPVRRTRRGRRRTAGSRRRRRGGCSTTGRRSNCR